MTVEQPRPPRWTLIFVICSTIQLLPTRVLAQTVEATLLDADSREPIGGALVTLVDSTGARAGVELTDTLGVIRLKAPGEGVWQLQAERIGYRTVTSAPFELVAQDHRTFTVRLPTEPIRMDELRVELEPICRPKRTGSRSASVLWEEARKALEAVAWTRTRRDFVFDVLLYERQLGRDRAVRREDAHERTVTSYRPFRTLPADLLAEAGYIQVSGEDTLYFGPDVDVLLSDEFGETHCFYSIADDDGDRLGLAFEPVDSRKSDIAGVLWLDARTAALLEITFRYTGPIAEAVDRPHEGAIGLRRLAEGPWIVETWWIRLPLYSRPLVLEDRGLPIARARRQLRFTGYKERGGIVRKVRRADRDDGAF